MVLKIKVVNKHHKQSGEYIGRGSPLGNKWSHMPNTKAEFKVDTRAQAVLLYKEWLNKKIAEDDVAVCDELNRLCELARDGELKLQCFCAPQQCHGDVIKQLIEEAFLNG